MNPALPVQIDVEVLFREIVWSGLPGREKRGKVKCIS